MKGKGVRLIKPKVPFLKSLIHANKGYLRIVISILLDNAARYTKRGGQVEFKVITEDSTAIQLSVSDTGIGISDAEQPRVFEKFFRANNALSLVPDGTGLGLFYAKQLVESQGGHMWFRSEEGRGSTFYFTLPLVTKRKAK